MEILTVSQLNRYISFRLKEDANLGVVYLRGEITDFKVHYASGHLYFGIKDSAARVKAVMFSSAVAHLRFEPYNGMNAIFTGSVRMYEKTGEVQLYVTDIVPDGVGAAFLAAEQLKAKLAAEGIFDEAHKKPLPRFPETIGAVTSATGAALRDIINVISRRYPSATLKVFDCLVQGDSAPASVTDALRRADQAGCDVIICGRGGGSAEDLIVFNDERIVRAVYAMQTPVISAVGHETDTTLIDYVSDMRAPTPSAAAELAVPDIAELFDTLVSQRAALDSGLKNILAAKQAKAAQLLADLRLLYPTAKLERLSGSAASLRYALDKAMAQCIASKESALAAAAASLEALSPLKTMARGYSLVYKGDILVRSSAELAGGDSVRLVFADGEHTAVVN